MIASMPGLKVSDKVLPETLPFYRRVQKQAVDLIDKDITAEQQRLAMSEMLHQKAVARLNANIDDLKLRAKRFGDPDSYSGRAHHAALQTKLNTPEGLSVDELAVWRRLSRKYSPENESLRADNLTTAEKALTQMEAISAVSSMLAPLADYKSNTGANAYIAGVTTPLERREMAANLTSDSLIKQRIHPGLFRERVDLEGHQSEMKNLRRIFRPVGSAS